MTRGASPEVRRENVERKLDTKAELQKLKDDIATEQHRILARANRRHNEKYDDKLRDNEHVLIGKVNAMVDKIETTDALTLTRKVTMLQAVYSVLNDYIRGLDGLFTKKDNVTLKLSGLLEEFDTEIDNKRIIQNHKEEVSARKVVVTRDPERAKVVIEGTYIVKKEDTLTGVVGSALGIDFNQNPIKALVAVKTLNSLRGENSDPNLIYPGEKLHIERAKVMLTDRAYLEKQTPGILGWYASYPSTRPAWVKALKNIIDEKKGE